MSIRSSNDTNTKNVFITIKFVLKNLSPNKVFSKLSFFAPRCWKWLCGVVFTVKCMSLNKSNFYSGSAAVPASHVCRRTPSESHAYTTTWIIPNVYIIIIIIPVRTDDYELRRMIHKCVYCIFMYVYTRWWRNGRRIARNALQIRVIITIYMYMTRLFVGC